MEQISKNLRLEGFSPQIRQALYTDFSAKIIVIKNGRMTDDKKRIARTTSERETKFKKPNAFKSISIFLGLQLPM